MQVPWRESFVAVAALCAIACSGPRAASNASRLLGNSVAVIARDLEGHEVRVPRPAARVTVVDFWASWCEPCRDQLPFLARLADELSAAGVEVYAVSFDEDRAAMIEFLSHVPVSVPVLWDKGGAGLAEKLGITRLPTTLVIDHDGVVRSVHLGYDRAAGDALAAEVRRLAAE